MARRPKIDLDGVQEHIRHHVEAGLVLPGAHLPEHREPHIDFPFDKAAMDAHHAKGKARHMADLKRRKLIR